MAGESAGSRNRSFGACRRSTIENAMPSPKFILTVAVITIVTILGYKNFLQPNISALPRI